jgi:hypothetical protein
MKADRAWGFLRIRSGCPVRGEERALESNIYYGSGAFIVQKGEAII